MVVAVITVVNKANQLRFFGETFLVANISPEIVLGMLFLILSNGDVDFLGQKLWWRMYTTEKALPTTKHVKLVGKEEFVAAVLKPEYKTYIVHVLFFTSTLLDIYYSQISQISSSIAKNAFMKVLDKYTNFADVFSPNLVSKLPKHTGINDYAIKLVNGQQTPYGYIHSLGQVELEILKAYIDTNLANNFFQLSTSLPVLPSCLIGSHTVFFSCALIIEVSTISQSRTNTHWY